MKYLAVRRRDLAQIAEGENVAEGGFTLVELMVVLLIIAILLAIAIPTFFGLTTSANDRAAQATLTNALNEGKSLYGVDGSYANQSGTAYGQSDFASQAPEYHWAYNTACPTTESNCVSALIFDVGSTGDSEGLSLAVDSTTTNTCWYVFDLEVPPGVSPVSTEFPGAGTFYGISPPAGQPNSGIPSGGCIALNPSTATISVGNGAGENYASAVSMNS